MSGSSRLRGGILEVVGRGGNRTPRQAPSRRELREPSHTPKEEGASVSIGNRLLRWLLSFVSMAIAILQNCYNNVKLTV